MSAEPIHQPIDKHAGPTGMDEAPEPKLAKYFRAMMKHAASDLHLKAHAPPHIRIKSKIRATRRRLTAP